jgi:hypothetical protein
MTMKLTSLREHALREWGRGWPSAHDPASGLRGLGRVFQTMSSSVDLRFRSTMTSRPSLGGRCRIMGDIIANNRAGYSMQDARLTTRSSVGRER